MVKTQQQSWLNLSLLDIYGVSAHDNHRQQLQEQAQQTIWESIIRIELLPQLEQQQLKQVENLWANPDSNWDEKIENLQQLVKKWLPNWQVLLEIYTDAFKKDVLLERIEGTLEFYRQSDDHSRLQAVENASQLFSQGQYFDCVQVLNQLGAEV